MRSSRPPRSCPTPEVEQMMQQGVSLMRVPEQWDQALELFDRMVTLAPTFAEVCCQHVWERTVC